MKFNKILSLFGIGALLVFGACEPIEERLELTNSFDPNEIELEVEQATPGGNKLTMKMNTKGVTGYWDYIFEEKYTDKVEIVFPFKGELTFNYNVTTPYMPDNNPGNREFVQKSIDVQIDTLDHKLPDAYYPLVGSDLEGKKWEFDGEPFDDTDWWVMVPPYGVSGSDFSGDDPDDLWKDGSFAIEPWWNAAGECCPPFNVNTDPDADAKIGFNLDGNLNYTYQNSESTFEPEGVTWRFSDDYKYLFISDPQAMIGYKHEWGEPRANYEGKYRILELTEDKLVLYSAESVLWKDAYDEWEQKKAEEEDFDEDPPVPGDAWIWVLRPVEE